MINPRPRQPGPILTLFSIVVTVVERYVDDEDDDTEAEDHHDGVDEDAKVRLVHAVFWRGSKEMCHFDGSIRLHANVFVCTRC